MEIPATIQTTDDKLMFLYRAVELLRMEHNSNGDLYKLGQFSHFRSYQKDSFWPRMKEVLHQINTIKDAEDMFRPLADSNGNPTNLKYLQGISLKEAGTTEIKWDGEIDITK